MNDYIKKAILIMRDRHITPTWKEEHIKGIIQELLPEEEWKPKLNHWPGMYKPKQGDSAYTTDLAGNVRRANAELHGNDQIEGLREAGSCCATEEEAEFVKAHFETRRDLIDRIAELNEGWRPDWSDSEQMKYAPRFNHYDDEIIVVAYHKIQILPDYFHGKSGVWQQIFEEFDGDKIKLAIWPKYEEGKA
jgi:hypothetical protein